MTKVWLIVSILCLATGIGVRGLVMPGPGPEGDVVPTPAAAAVHDGARTFEPVEMGADHGPALGLFQYDGSSLVNYNRWSAEAGQTAAAPSSADTQ